MFEDEFAEAMDNVAIDEQLGDLKKKKKKRSKEGEKEKKEKKKEVGDGEDAEKPKSRSRKDKTDKTESELPLAFEITGKKKNKRKDKKPDSNADGLQLTKKKNNKKDKNVKVVSSVWGNMEQLNEADMAVHSYDDLLTRVFDRMDQLGVGKGSKGSKRIVCKPPTMVRIGTKKSGYQNFGQTCDDLGRTTKHVMQYILHETGTSGNLDITNQLIMRGRFKPAHMENILRDYIKEYIQCVTCKSANTTLDKIDRLTFMNCLDCSSRRTVASMQAGFQAVVGKRKKLREKQGVGAGNAATQ